MKLSLPFLYDRFLNPDGFKKAMLEYLKANKADVSIQKTLAEVAFYDQKTIATLTDEAFFRGQVDPNNTNVGNSYTRPEAEHVIITRIRIANGVNAVVEDTDWTVGSDVNYLKNGTLTVDVNGVVALRDYPLLEAVPDLTTDDQGFINLSEPILWLGQTNLGVRYSSPVAAVANANLRIEMHGVGLIS